MPKAPIQTQPWPANPDYAVSRCGKVFRNGKARKPSWGTKGYLRLNIRTDKGMRTIPVHRIVLETYKGKRPKGKQCRHLNGDKSDNSVDNLAWGTHGENMQDKIDHGTTDNVPKGTAHFRAKMTEAQVIEARLRASKGESVASFAGEYGLTPSGMRAVVNGRKWKHLPHAIKRKPGPKPQADADVVNW